jgi:hypothetical protein
MLVTSSYVGIEDKQALSSQGRRWTGRMCRVWERAMTRTDQAIKLSTDALHEPHLRFHVDRRLWTF